MGLSFGKRLPVQLRLAPELMEALQAAAHGSGRSINSWVTDAIVVRLGNWEHPMEKIAAKRAAGKRTPATLFDPKKFNEFGLPIECEYLPPANTRAEIGQALRRSKGEVRKFVRQYWGWNGLNPDDYTDAMLEETIRVYNASKPKPKPGGDA